MAIVVFHKGNVEDLKDKLEALCMDEKLVAKYKKDVSEFICNKYDWDVVTDKTMTLYGY